MSLQKYQHPFTFSMFLFTLKKIIGLLLTPLNVSLILLLLAIILFKYKPKLSRISLISGFVVLFLSSSVWFSKSVIHPYENQYSVFTQQTAPLDYIVVLGCGHVTNKERPILTQLKVCALQRILEAHRIYQMHPEAKIITTGYGGTDEYSSAYKLKEAAISLGIPKSIIITEERAKDTQEEAELIAHLLQNKTFALITNADHIPRAYRYFEQQNLYPIAAPTGYLNRGGEMSYHSFIPKPSALQMTTRAWYESLGSLVQWLKE